MTQSTHLITWRATGANKNQLSLNFQPWLQFVNQYWWLWLLCSIVKFAVVISLILWMTFQGHNESKLAAAYGLQWSRGLIGQAVKHTEIVKVASYIYIPLVK